jgi:DNA-binding SARP family transcriptional activator/tetratricopeptide (TPR) repeat protein
VEFRLLGPVEVWSRGRAVPVGGGKPRALLAALLLAAGRPVTVERLVEAVWNEDPPKTARAVLHSYVAALRRSFAAEGAPRVLLSHRVGYLADVPPGALDLDVFTRHVACGREAARRGDPVAASAALGEALALWRGPALSGTGESFLRGQAGELDELRITVTSERIAADLAAGHHVRLVGELTALVDRHPVHEVLRRDLMIALYRSGRQSDALEVFREGRRVLADELGIEPGPHLRAAHQAILGSDAELLGPGDRARGTPRQLPAVAPDFTGRAEEVALLTGSLRRGDAVPVCVISGAGGAGKSALAVRVAHEVSPDYPGGQLFVELRGTTSTPSAPHDVLSRLVRELGVPHGPLPPAVDELAALYRSLLAGRRVLVVLDDAATEAQVRPLLPGSAGCGVLVTSRTRLVLAGASVTDLPVLDAEAALALLGRIAGGDRVLAEEAVARDLVRHCGFLPLAVRIAGAKLAARRRWPIEFLVRRLGDERRRLDELVVGDQEVRASIGLSYELLGDGARAVLRVLGALGLPHFSAWTVSTATGTSRPAAERLLEQLVDASLVEVEGVDSIGHPRYRLHDLIRIFAGERARAESPHERDAAVTAVLGGWLWLLARMAVAAPTGAIEVRASYDLAVEVDAEVACAVLADPHAWFRAEEESLIVGVHLASSSGLDQIAVELVSALASTVFVSEDLFPAWQRTHDAALSAAIGNGNTAGEATLLAEVGQLRFQQDRFAEAQDSFVRALRMFRASGDRRGECAALSGIGAACRERGELAEALRHLEPAALTWRELGATVHLAEVRRLAGSVRLEQGDFARSWQDLEEALDLFRSAGSRRGEAMTLRTRALHHLARDRPHDALAAGEQAERIFRDCGDQLLESYAARVRAKAQVRLGRFDAAREPLQRCLAVVRALQDRWGEAVTLRVLGELHLAQGDLPTAERRLLESLRQWEELDAGLFRARTLRDLAAVWRGAGDVARADAALAEALELFRAHGAREALEIAR